MQLGGQAAATTLAAVEGENAAVTQEDQQLLLVKFIQHKQSEEFIEVYKMF